MNPLHGTTAMKTELERQIERLNRAEAAGRLARAKARAATTERERDLHLFVARLNESSADRARARIVERRLLDSGVEA